MNAALDKSDWVGANQRYLSAALASVKKALRAHAERLSQPGGSARSSEDQPGHEAKEMEDIAATMPAPPAIESLSAVFGLSEFERDTLLLCAGPELDSAFPELCAAAHGDPRCGFPSFSLALAALPNAHWTAVNPAAPLRRWRLIETGPNEGLTASPLRIDERILHYLTGVSYVDERLRGILEPLGPPEELPPSQATVAERAADVLKQTSAAPPVVQLCTRDTDQAEAIALAAGRALGLTLFALRSADLPAAAVERESLVRLWTREALLARGALLVKADEADAGELNRAIHPFLEAVAGVVLVQRQEPLSLSGRTVVRFDVRKPTGAEQAALWQRALGPLAGLLNGEVERLVAQFNFSPSTIHAASLQALRPLEQAREIPREKLAGALWSACCTQSRPGLDELAQRIEPVARWCDLVLPEGQSQTLREIAGQVRQRAKVYEQWGFRSKGGRGLGVSALFTGASGTGKTLAAEVLAHELQLDLFRIDLSQVVSKYIGETEKNLRRVFDSAETGGAILLFDEADALFGKRSEVRDSHDRYANIEVSYLLQRMEAYRGLAILTTNKKEALDTAFLRRIRFVVQFPFPDAAQRAGIWSRMFPEKTPLDGVEVLTLSRLNIPGGNIRNIAVNAAFLAADQGEAVGMKHLLRAARNEYAKIEKPLTAAELGDWL